MIYKRNLTNVAKKIYYYFLNTCKYVNKLSKCIFSVISKDKIYYKF